MTAQGPGLALRLIAAHVVVLATAAATVVVVTLAVGPRVFADHLHGRDGVTSEAFRHAEEAFRAASAIALAVALLVSVAVAVAVAAVATRRITRPVRAVADAARALADTRYDVRVPDTHLGPEMDALTDAFNVMAERLQATEATRRRLLSDLGHELRTPLATIEAYADGLAEGVLEPTQDNWAVLTAQTARMRRLTEDIAAVSRADEGRLDLRRERLDPRPIVDSAVATARPAYEAKQVALVADVDGHAPAVLADPDRLAQVLGNLLDNALRHTPAGGRVTVAARPDAGMLRLSVTDTGEGIPAEHLPHVFERFYRVDTARDRGHGGSGIGLAIVRAIAHAHGGTVSSESSGPGAGTTFSVLLPAATEL